MITVSLLRGLSSQLPRALTDEFTRQLGRPTGNLDLRPDLLTLHQVPWAGFGKYRVGEVLGDLFFEDGTAVDYNPRYSAQKQLDRLDKMGFQFLSSYEFEFILEDSKTMTPVFDGSYVLSNLLVGQNEQFLYQVDQDMLKAGVNVEMMETESSSGQFEINMVPVYGIGGADKAFILKQGIKEIAHHHGLHASFMAKPYLNECGNGAHYNISLWNKADGTNAFFDKEGEHQLSDIARHWLGGMLKHGAALSAFMSPTVNCYRRLHGPWSPSVISWDIDNRHASIRLKNACPKSTYMEHRVPSGSCNPYLVLASTVAAGLDGLINKIEPPAPGIEGPLLPKTLSSALKHLEDDKILVEALGQDLVGWFTTMKRCVDVELLKDSQSDHTVAPDALEAERRMYNFLI